MKVKNRLAVILPGIGYHKDKPLLYYATKLVKAKGYKVICIDYSGMPKDIKGDAAKMATHAGGAVGFFDASCETWACAGIVFELFLVCKDAFGRPKGWASGHSAALSGRV